jgi:hypothetical protein
VSFALAASGCAFTGATTPARAAAEGAAPRPTYSWVGQAVGPQLVVDSSPGGPVEARLPNPNAFGEPLTVVPVAQSGTWLKVLLPIRPNGSTGWVQESALKLMWVTYRLEVSRSHHRLVLYDAGRPILRSPVAVGAPATPTPRGTFYLTALLKPSQPGGAYGPYAFGLSGFSPVLRHFAGGPGQLGLHGTDAAWSIGHSVTHGCIRVPNRIITKLAHRLPLGTPLVVTS